MEHVHNYESYMHKGISPRLRELGLEAADIRKCRKCGSEMPFVLTRKGDWVPLYDETRTEQQDILLA